MHPATTPSLLDRLAALRVELVDLAYALDVRGACAAAEVAMTTSARIAELCDEFSAQPRDANSRQDSTARSEKRRLNMMKPVKLDIAQRRAAVRRGKHFCSAKTAKKP